MKTKEINIQVKGKKEFYLKLLTVMWGFPPFNELREQELNLFALVMYHWDLHRGLKIEDRKELVFSVKNRKLMAEELGIKVSNLTTLIYELRKKKLLVDDIPMIQIWSTPQLQLVFNFNILDYDRE